MSKEPISNRVIVLPDKAETETEAGLIIPDSALEVPLQGVVCFIGPKVAQCKVGDRVLFTKYAGNETVLSGFDRPIKILREEDILVRIFDEEHIVD